MGWRVCVIAVILTLCLQDIVSRPSNVPPVVVMHGILGAAEKMEDVKSWIQAALPNTYVKLMEIGNGPTDSIFMDMNKQVEVFCQEIYADEKLKDGFNLIGFSQGGLVSRGYIQRCNRYPVINFLSWASPQGGQFGGEKDLPIPPQWAVVLNKFPYEPWVQKIFSVCQYWKDPYNNDAYLNGSTFIADLNNDRQVKNQTYKQQITSLKTLMLLYSPNDDVISPPSSGWFNFYAPFTGPGPYGRILPVQDSDFYKEDWLGIKTLGDSGRLQFHESNCSHEDHPRETCKHAFETYSLPILSEPWVEVHSHWEKYGLYSHLRK